MLSEELWIELTVDVFLFVRTLVTSFGERMDCFDEDPLYSLLELTNDEFVPPLSLRYSTMQENFSGDGDSAPSDGVRAYYEALRNQKQIRIIDNDILVGFASYVHKEHSNKQSIAYLSTIIVHPDFRGRGISKKLYRILFEIIEEDFVELRTWSTNRTHLRILAELGFKETIRLKDDRDIGVDTIYFRCSKSDYRG